MGLFDVLTGGRKAERSAKREAGKLRDFSRQLGKDTQFMPIGVKTGMGEFSYDPYIGYRVEQDPATMRMQQGYMDNAASLFNRAAVDPSKRAAEITQEQIDLIQPELQRQQTALQQNLFGSGRMGLQVSGNLVGAGGGMVNPEAFGYNQALGQTLAGISANARNQALGEQTQLAQIGQGLFGAGQAMNQRELDLLRFGLDAEATRQAGNIASGQLSLGGFQNAGNMISNAAQRRSDNQAAIVGGILSGATGGLFG